jgi:outer membrane lipoprotein-sorting protein
VFGNEEEFAKAVAKLNVDAQPRPEHQAELRRRMLAAFDQARGETAAPGGSRLAGLRSLIVNRRFMRVAAAAAIVVCVVGVVAVWNPTARSGVALAAVRQRVEQARTACFKLTWYRDGKVEYSGEVKWREPGLMRWEVPGMITIYDWDKGKFVVLMTEARTAHSAEISDLDNPYHRDWIHNLKEMIGSESAEEAGRKDVSGPQAKGWRFREEGWVCTIWADAKTAELLEVEFQTGNTRMVMSEFVLDAELEESLFSLTPPADYACHTQLQMKAGEPAEKDLILLVRVWAMGNGDAFPDSLDARQFSSAAAKVDWTRLEIKSQEEAKQVQDAISRGFWFLYSAYDRTYAGKGVRLGQKETPVFWYRPGKSKNYRVIYADLSVKDVPPEELPKTRSETQPAPAGD